KPVENPKVLDEAGSPAPSGAWEEVTARAFSVRTILCVLLQIIHDLDCRQRSFLLAISGDIESSEFCQIGMYRPAGFISPFPTPARSRSAA
ncbi:MAG: hypothetical protein LUQ59_06380, partial [Methanothrix sp.]|nr:hypothetical protein [Methanothrix sp.]